MAALLLTLILLPFAGSVVAAFQPADARNRQAALAGLVSVSGLLVTAYFYSEISSGGAVRYGIEWLPMLGVNFVLRMDGLVWLFVMLVLFIANEEDRDVDHQRRDPGAREEPRRSRRQDQPEHGDEDEGAVVAQEPGAGEDQQGGQHRAE